MGCQGMMPFNARPLDVAHAFYSCHAVAAMCATPREAVSQPGVGSFSVHRHLRFPAARVDMTHRHLHTTQPAVTLIRGSVDGEITPESGWPSSNGFHH